MYEIKDRDIDRFYGEYEWPVPVPERPLCWRR